MTFVGRQRTAERMAGFQMSTEASVQRRCQPALPLFLAGRELLYNRKRGEFDGDLAANRI